MEARCHSRFLYAFIEMMLLAIHIVAIGCVVGATAYIAYYLGKKDGLNYPGKEHEKNGNVKKSAEFEK